VPVKVPLFSRENMAEAESKEAFSQKASFRKKDIELF
jgi:hypothetical protein